MFSLARALPSPISAEVCPSLFDRFTGTMARSDSSATCRSAVRLFAFSGRSRSWLDREVPRQIVEQARKRIQAATGIAGGRVMISATHAHTGPVIPDGSSRYNLEGEMAD